MISKKSYLWTIIAESNGWHAVKADRQGNITERNDYSHDNPQSALDQASAYAWLEELPVFVPSMEPPLVLKGNQTDG